LYVIYTQIRQKQALMALVLAEFIEKPTGKGLRVHFLLAHPVDI